MCYRRRGTSPRPTGAFCYPKRIPTIFLLIATTSICPLPHIRIVGRGLVPRRLWLSPTGHIWGAGVATIKHYRPAMVSATSNIRSSAPARHGLRGKQHQRRRTRRPRQIACLARRKARSCTGRTASAGNTAKQAIWPAGHLPTQKREKIAVNTSAEAVLPLTSPTAV